MGYAAEVLCFESKKFSEWLKSFCYQAYKKLLNINKSIGKEKLLEMAMGHKWECWLTEKLNKTRRKLKLKNQNLRLCDCTEPKAHDEIDIEEPTPIKAAARFGCFNILKWRIDEFLSGWRQARGA